MKNDNDIFIAMSSFALINIDEFDALSKKQQPILKYLLSKHDVKMRPPYGKVMEQRQRFASFIATTNNLRPLIDQTGSRRFVCVYADEIDNGRRISHDQIYAQLLHELKEGKRYWFTETENKRLMQQNSRFQQVGDYENMIRLTYAAPDETPEETPYTLLHDIMMELAGLFPTMKIKSGTSIELGRVLRAMGYEYKKIKSGITYKVVKG